MKKMITAVLLFALPVYVNAADIGAGKTKSSTCAVCHGANGISASPIYPNLSGQKEAYLVSSLKAYKAAQRQGGMAVIMNAQAKGLSDVDIADLAAYYSSLK